MSPVRLDRMRTGLYRALSAELAPAVVQWGRGNVPDAALGDRWLSLQLIGGPSPWRWTRARGRAIPRILGATLTVGAVAEGDVVILEVNRVAVRVDVPADGSAESTRDALLAGLEGEPGVASCALGSDALRIEPSAPGGLWDVRAEGAALTLDLGTGDQALLAFTSGLYQVRIEVQTFARSAAQPPDVHGAQELASAAQHALCTSEVSEALYAAGVGLGDRNAPLVDLSAIAGPYWQSRAAFVFSAFLLGTSARAVTTVEAVETLVQGRIEDVIVQIPFTV